MRLRSRQACTEGADNSLADTSPANVSKEGGFVCPRVPFAAGNKTPSRRLLPEPKKGGSYVTHCMLRVKRYLTKLHWELLLFNKGRNRRPVLHLEVPIRSKASYA